MREVELTQNKFAIVDDDDLDQVNKYKWYAIKKYNTWYARKNPSVANQSVYMHHFIIGQPPDNMQVDHINRNGLDNRKSNLRFATRGQNMQNIKPYGGTSRFRGVQWDGSRQKWKVYISIDNHPKFLGRFDSEIEAAKAYDCASQKN